MRVIGLTDTSRDTTVARCDMHRATPYTRTLTPEIDMQRVITYATLAALRSRAVVTLVGSLDNQAEYAGALRMLDAVAQGLRDAGMIEDAASFRADVLADVKGLMA